jgi:hypothetical protein
VSAIKRVEITEANVIVGEGAGDAAFFAYLCQVHSILGFQFLDAGGESKFEQYLKDLPAMTGFKTKCKVLVVVGDNDDKIEAAFKRVRLAVKRAALPVPDKAQQIMKWTTQDLRVGIVMIPFNDVGESIKGCLETLLLASAFEHNEQIAKCIPEFGKCVGSESWTNGSHIDKFKLRALLAAAFPDDPNFGLQYALKPEHGVIPLDHRSFAGVVDFLRSIPNLATVERQPE